MKRRSLTALQRLKIFEAAKGCCHICGLKVQTGERWDVEHIVPLALGGCHVSDSSDGYREGNLAPAHIHCHKSKTVDDVARIAKAKRQSAKHHGAKQSKWPKSKWKRKVSGETVLRKESK